MVSGSAAFAAASLAPALEFRFHGRDVAEHVLQLLLALLALRFLQPLRELLAQREEHVERAGDLVQLALRVRPVVIVEVFLCW